MECRKILLIEDNSLVRWWILKCLTREGFTVEAPASVDEALSLAAKSRFDVLVSDWRLPDGYDGLKVLTKAREAFPGIVSILISAEADAELTERALGAGFDRVIQKPLEMSQIVEAIKSSTA